MINFEELSDSFYSAKLSGSPSELHGMLCGRISGGQSLAEAQVLQYTAQLFDVSSEQVEDMGDALPSLYHQLCAEITNDGFEFQLLLPDDEMPISERLMALGQWCQGFLFGLGNSGLSVETSLSDEVEEVLQDLAAISQVSVDADDDEDGEVNFAQLVEYVRVAAMTVNAEFNLHESSDEPRVLH